MRQVDLEGGWSRWAMFVVVSVLVVAVDGLGWLNGVKGGMEKGLAGVEARTVKVVELAGAPARVMTYFVNGEARIADLQARLAERLVDYKRLADLEEENERMRLLLGAPLRPELKFVPVRVLGVSGMTGLIEGGEKEGLRKGMTVVSGEVLVGVVSKVSSRVSEMRLVADSESRVAGRVVEGGAKGIVEIDDKGRLVLSGLLQDDKVAAGNVVVSAGTDGVEPDLVIGVAREVVSGQGQVHKSVVVERAIEPRKLGTVFVIVNN